MPTGTPSSLAPPTVDPGAVGAPRSNSPAPSADQYGVRSWLASSSEPGPGAAVSGPCVAPPSPTSKRQAGQSPWGASSGTLVPPLGQVASPAIVALRSFGTRRWIAPGREGTRPRPWRPARVVLPNP